jgi:hypothetical protein
MARDAKRIDDTHCGVLVDVADPELLRTERD